jgi:GntR family colanic acid and biofilm gene transcriptional regulator
MAEASNKVDRFELANLAARTYGSIKQSLIAGKFLPGERLRIRELASTFGTSATPVREALLRLTSEHALELQAARQIAVPELSTGRYLEIRTIRLALEPLAVELAVPRLQPTDIERLTNLQHQFIAAEGRGDVEEEMRTNREFHLGLYAHARLPMLQATIENLWASMGPILKAWYLSGMSDYQGATEHENVLRCLRQRDAIGAARAMQNDILIPGPSILRFLESAEAKRAP